MKASQGHPKEVWCRECPTEMEARCCPAEVPRLAKAPMCDSTRAVVTSASSILAPTSHTQKSDMWPVWWSTASHG